jgi:hypothetical protein
MTLIIVGNVAMAERDGMSNPEPDFDPVAASATMRTIAAFAKQCAGHGTQLDREFVRKAIGELRAAQTWLDLQLADLSISDRRPLVTEAEDVDRIGIDTLVYTLRYAAIAVLHAQRLLEHRARQDDR